MGFCFTQHDTVDHTSTAPYAGVQRERWEKVGTLSWKNFITQTHDDA
jgi:hypothetical protein